MKTADIIKAERLQALTDAAAGTEEVTMIAADRIRLVANEIAACQRFGCSWLEIGRPLIAAGIFPEHATPKRICAGVYQAVKMHKSRSHVIAVPVSAPEVTQVVQADTNTRPIAQVAEPPSPAKKAIPQFLQPKLAATDTTDVDAIRAITDKHKR